MKTIFAGLTILLALGSAACDTSKHLSIGQAVDLEAGKRLVVHVEGVQNKPGAAENYSMARDGEPIHRILRSADGTVLFSYDLQVSKSGEGAYTFLLKPADKGPTFAATREVTMNAHDAVRIQLMEQPGTGRKVEDVFMLADADGTAAETHAAIGAHLRKMHQMIYNWVHGE